MGDLLTIKQVAKILRVSEPRVRLLFRNRNGVLLSGPGRYKYVMVPRSVLDRYLQNREEEDARHPTRRPKRKKQVPKDV